LIGIRQSLGPVTALAHNASRYGRGEFLQMDPDQIRQSFYKRFERAG
jgi:hypothetical protein